MRFEFNLPWPAQRYRHHIPRQPYSNDIDEEQQSHCPCQKRSKFFTQELAKLGRAIMTTTKTISIRPSAMVMTGQGWSTHLVSQNKHIYLWHRRLAHVSNAWVVRVSRLTSNGIDLNTEIKEYNTAEIPIEFDESDVPNPSDSKEPPDSLTLAHTALAYQTRTKDTLNKLYETCVRSKSTRVIRCNKSITATTDKLEEVHANLLGPHNPPSQQGSTYAAILICEHTRKTWTLYLQGKDNFVDAFQA